MRLAKLFFKGIYLAIIEGKTSPTDSVNDSLNLVALHPTIFALYFWIAYLTSHPFVESVEVI